MWKAEVMDHLEPTTTQFPGKTKKNHETVRQYNLIPGHDLKSKRPAYKKEVTTVSNVQYISKE
jgi:hypothetical protein